MLSIVEVLMRAACLLLLVFLGTIARADDAFVESKTTLKEVPALVASTLKWVKNVDAKHLQVSYTHGKAIDAAADSLREGLQRLSRTRDSFVESPSLHTSFQIVQTLYDIEHSFDQLMDAMADADTGSQPTSNRLFNWFASGRPHQTEFNALRFNFGTSHSGELIVTDFKLRDCSKETSKARTE